MPQVLQNVKIITFIKSKSKVTEATASSSIWHASESSPTFEPDGAVTTDRKRGEFKQLVHKLENSGQEVLIIT